MALDWASTIEIGADHRDRKAVLTDQTRTLAVPIDYGYGYGNGPYYSRAPYL